MRDYRKFNAIFTVEIISESDVFIQDTLDGHITEELTSDHIALRKAVFSCVLMCRCCELHN